MSLSDPDEKKEFLHAQLQLAETAASPSDSSEKKGPLLAQLKKLAETIASLPQDLVPQGLSAALSTATGISSSEELKNTIDKAYEAIQVATEAEAKKLQSAMGSAIGAAIGMAAPAIAPANELNLGQLLTQIGLPALAKAQARNPDMPN